MINTLDQYPRRHLAGNVNNSISTRELIEECACMMDEHDLTIEQCLGIIAEAREQKNAVYYRNDLDIKDEQLASFGAILEEFTGAVQEMSLHISTIADKMEMK